MIWISFFLLSMYVSAILVTIYYWAKIKPLEQPDVKATSVTVLVPVRNEAGGIVKTLNSILSNDYEHLEIIVIDDHSTDATIEETESVSSDKIIIINLTKEVTGKKAAITKGVSLAKNDLVVCTDGDTIVSSNWLREHVQSYLSGNKLSFGPVTYQSKTIWIDVLNVELLALVGVGGASVQAGYASMINGCNYSFSKNAFEEVGGFQGNENIPTGDDEFLLRKIKKAYPDKLRFLKSKDSCVRTDAVNTFKQLIDQRRRWASKWKYHHDLGSKTLPVFLFLIYCSVLSIPWFLSGNELFIFFNMLIVKAILDFVLVNKIAKDTNLSVYIPAYMLLEIIYPFYVIFFGLASNFGKYQWQSRSYHV